MVLHVAIPGGQDTHLPFLSPAPVAVGIQPSLPWLGPRRPFSSPHIHTEASKSSASLPSHALLSTLVLPHPLLMALSSHATTAAAAAAVGTFPQSTRSSSRRFPASSVSPRPPPPPRSLRLDHAVAPSLSPATMPAPDGLLAAAIEHLEREPASVAADEAPLAALSPRELQLVLVYFAQEGRDTYCALEVFDWLRRANRVDGETMELMAAIACGWIERLVGAGGDVADVAALLGEMDCVGLRPGFSLVEKAVALYWDRGEKELAVEFVRDVLRRGGLGAGAGGEHSSASGDGERGGPVGYLAWKMMVKRPHFTFPAVLTRFNLIFPLFCLNH